MNERALKHWENTCGCLRREEAELLFESFRTLLPEGGQGIEIGSAFGKSSGIIASAINPNKLICIDPWGWGDCILDDLIKSDIFPRDWNPQLTEAQAELKAYDLFLDNVKEYSNIVAVQGFSGVVLPLISNEFNEMCFIDGDHSYEGCRADLSMVLSRPNMRAIVLHDYKDTDWPGVTQAANELLKREPDAIADRLAVWKL